MENIQLLYAKIKTAASRKPYPVFVDIPQDIFANQRLSNIIEFYSMLDEMIFSFFPSFLNKLIYPALTEQEQIRIKYINGYKPSTSTKNQLDIYVTRDDLNFMNVDSIKIGIHMALTQWLSDLQ